MTRSGGNEFSGAVYGYFRPSSLESEWKQGTSPNGTVNTTGRNDYDFVVSLGGPLMRDKMFFFGTLNPQFQERSFIAPEGFQYRTLGDVTRKRKIYSYAGKLTWQANSNHRFDVSVFGDPSTGEAGLQRPVTLRRIAYPGNPGTASIEGGFSELEYGAHNQTLRYDGIISLAVERIQRTQYLVVGGLLAVLGLLYGVLFFIVRRADGILRGQEQALRGNLESLQESQSQLARTQYAVDHAADMVFWTDAGGNFIYVNETSCRRLGYPREELLCLAVPVIDPEYPREAWPLVWEWIKREGRIRVQILHRTRSGETYPAEVTVNT